MPRGNVTAHIRRVSQNQENIVTMVLSEAQVLELVSLLTVGLREKATHADGYHITVRPELHVENCQLDPGCEGGEGMINLVRPSKRRSPTRTRVTEPK